MKKYGLILTLVIAVIISGCNGNAGEKDIHESSTEAFATEENSIEQAASETTMTEEATSIMEEVTEKLPQKPTFADETAKVYNNEEKGKELIYEYNETLGKWECVFVYGDVRIISAKSGNVRIEYEGKSIELPWTIQLFGTGEGISIRKQDINGDGSEEVIFVPYIREAHPTFIFDLANWVDLSPYYCNNNGRMLYNGVYLNEEYTKIMLEALETALDQDGYSYEFTLREDGSLDVGKNMSAKLDENGILHFRFFLLKKSVEWEFSADFAFDENGCKMINMDVTTKYSRCLEMVNKRTEYSLEPEVTYDDDTGVYSFSFSKENTCVGFESGGNKSAGKITVEHDGQIYPLEWIVGVNDTLELYFELKDVDEDGFDELVKYQTLWVGEKEVYEYNVYDFETMSEITQ